jgi:hypothetical protein
MPLLVPSMARQPRVPDTELQRSAMKKLSFLVGKWSGEARILRGSGQPLELVQTEEAQYKLDGLVLMIEGIGRNKTDGKAALQALGVVSYDDEAGTYHMRAYNDGRYLETELKLADSGKAFCTVTIAAFASTGAFSSAKQTMTLLGEVLARTRGSSQICADCWGVPKSATEALDVLCSEIGVEAQRTEVHRRLSAAVMLHSALFKNSLPQPRDGSLCIGPLIVALSSFRCLDEYLLQLRPGKLTDSFYVLQAIGSMHLEPFSWNREIVVFA